MNEEDTRAAIIESLRPMFEQARSEGLWFHSSYQDLWFSPDDLEAAQSNGRFVWGPINWKLRPPEDYARVMEERAHFAATAAADARKKISGGAG